MSLVVEYCKDAWSTQSSAEPSQSVGDSALARLALSPILIDTTNLSDGKKTTQIDLDAVDFLESKFDHASAVPPYTREGLYHEVSKAKESLDDISVYDILRKDYKEWEESGMKLGMSSVVKDLHWLIAKAGSDRVAKGDAADSSGHPDEMALFVSVAERFAKDRELSIFAIMTTSNTAEKTEPDGGESRGKFKRELLVWALDHSGSVAAKAFEVTRQTELKLQTWGSAELHESTSDKYRRAWVQENVACSRKQVGPMLRQAMHSK
jgi:exopolyphosphatase